ncbi:MAG: hypothetical protein Q4C80_01940 [Bacillota bacterium]|nr:hypothetical protein [Bacillota bacterium]
MTLKPADRNTRLTTDQAEQMLSNIFEICKIEPCTVSLKTLEDYSHYRADRFTLRKVVVIFILLAFWAMPFLFMAPELTVADKTTDKAAPKYEIAVHSILPVKSVTAEIDGKNVPVFETGKSVYTMEPESSGTMVVTATIANAQINTVEIEVNITPRDITPPALDKSNVTGGKVYLYLSDKGSGIDYDAISGLDNRGNKVSPLSIQKKKRCVIFPCPTVNTAVTIPDRTGNVLQLTLRPAN